MIKTSVLAATALAALLAGAPAFGQTTAPSPAAPPPSSAPPATTAQPSGSAPPSASSTGAPQASTGNTIQSAQQALQQNGFYKGTVDGKMGPHTRQAIKSFQQSKGLHATGHLNQKTLTALGVTG
jgi:His-Xaa-Ser repeat protein HxsA